MNKDDFTFGPFSDFVGEIDEVSVIEVDEPSAKEHYPEPRNADPAFVADREERRQRGIAAKRVRVNPALVAFGLRDETRQQLNSARRNKAI